MTKPNAIEEILAEAMAVSRRRVVPGGPPPTTSPMPQIQIDGYIHAARECLSALDAAGLAVVPKEATSEMALAAIACSGEWETIITRANAAFDPTTWKPKS